jgi:hypothetical protein
MNKQTDSHKPKKNQWKLSGWWRFGLSFAGALLIFLSIAIYTTPPSRLEWQKVDGGATTTTGRQADPTTLAVSLLSMGVIALLFAANGLRLRSGSKDHFEFGPSDDDVRKAQETERAQSTTPGKTADKQIEGKDSPEPKGAAIKTVGDDAVFEPEDVPITVFTDLLTEYPDAIEKPADIKFALRKTGRGNHPWRLTHIGGQVYTVAYGGRGKEGASVEKQ